MGISIEAALRELVPSERELSAAWARGVFLHTNGLLTQDLWDKYERLRLEVEALEQTLYTHIRSVLEPIGQADEIEEPHGYPQLPQPGTSTPAAHPEGVSGAGLGAAPAIVWGLIAASTLIYLAIVGALAMVAWKGLQVGQDIVDRIVSVRGNTLRYRAQVQAVQQRFMACLRRTGDANACAERHSVPQPPLEDRPPRATDPMAIFAALAGLGAAGALGYMGYRVVKKYSAASAAPKRISRAKGNPQRLSGAELRRSLTS